MGSLAPEDKRVRWIKDMKVVLKENMFAGEPIRKNRFLRSTFASSA
jgi:hypothetical protein